MARSTFVRISGATVVEPLTTRDTVARGTPPRAATCSSVGRFRTVPLRVPSTIISLSPWNPPPGEHVPELHRLAAGPGRRVRRVARYGGGAGQHGGVVVDAERVDRGRDDRQVTVPDERPVDQRGGVGLDVDRVPAAQQGVEEDPVQQAV